MNKKSSKTSLSRDKQLEVKKQNEKRKREESGELSSSSQSSDSSTSSSSSSSSTSSSSSSSSSKRKLKHKRTTKIGGEDGEIDSDRDKTQFSDELTQKIQSLKKLTDKTKLQFEKHQHKLEKIQRAYLKAEKESNKTNMKKCLKFRDKYRIKVDKIKSNLKLLQAKRAKLQQQADLSDKNKPKQVQETKQPKPIAKQPIKLPFPVLNDTRDKNTILGTLETKRVELLKKIDSNRFFLNDSQINYQRSEQLKQLEQLYESQLDKINIQLDYIKLTLNLESMREQNANRPMMMINNQHTIDQMSARLNELYNLMKAENKSYLKSINESKEEASSKSQVPQVSPPKPAPLKPIDKLNKLHESVNSSLAAVIAHTAASAHAAAAVAVTNYYLQSYYTQQQTDKEVDKTVDIAEIAEPTKPVVPLKTELENASSIFAKYKNKISSFFLSTQKVEETTKKTVESSGLNLLMSNYGDDANVSDTEIVEEIKKPVLVKEAENELSSEDNDESDESDIEIVTTSELKQLNVTRNYLMPSLKASYFPLKASIHQINASNNRSLIAVEKTKSALTFLGNGVAVGKQLKLNDILFNKY